MQAVTESSHAARLGQRSSARCCIIVIQRRCIWPLELADLIAISHYFGRILRNDGKQSLVSRYWISRRRHRRGTDIQETSPCDSI